MPKRDNIPLSAFVHVSSWTYGYDINYFFFFGELTDYAKSLSNTQAVVSFLVSVKSFSIARIFFQID